MTVHDHRFVEPTIPFNLSGEDAFSFFCPFCRNEAWGCECPDETKEMEIEHERCQAA